MALMSSGSALSGSRRTLELCWRSPEGPVGRGQGSQESVEEVETLMSDDKRDSLGKSVPYV